MIIFQLETLIDIHLVGGLEHFLFSHSNWECHHPNWRTHIFLSTTNQSFMVVDILHGYVNQIRYLCDTSVPPIHAASLPPVLRRGATCSSWFGKWCPVGAWKLGSAGCEVKKWMGSEFLWVKRSISETAQTCPKTSSPCFFSAFIPESACFMECKCMLHASLPYIQLLEGISFHPTPDAAVDPCEFLMIQYMCFEGYSPFILVFFG